MSFAFRSPNLTAPTSEGQIQQLLSFLRQHVQQLNWVLKDLEDTGTQQQTAQDPVSQSAEAFPAFYRKIRKKQAQENFVGAEKKTIFEGGPWETEAEVPADMEAVGRYTLFVAVVDGLPVACARQGAVLCGTGISLTCGETAITVTQADSPVTALYAVV